MRARLLVATLILAAATLQAQSQVTFDRILHAEREPQNWLSYSGTPMNQRYSGLTQITPANVRNLQQQWIWQARSLEKFEATPLVVDGVMYTVEAPNNIVALDAATGRPFWTFAYTPAPEGRPCCGRVNRGVAILGDTLYMATIDAHLLAVDAKSGQKVWNVVVADREGQGDRRRRRRRRPDSRLHHGVRREDRQGAVEVQHDSRAGRAG